MSTMSASQARAALPEVLDRVMAGEEVTITRHGTPVAVVVRPDVLRVRRAEGVLADVERLRDLLDRASSASLDRAPPLSAARADELVEGVRSSRSAR
jgi:antitoxin (DNA-binding transcriptional repressor) of toxin-antitoxin stability system